ncbi:beta-galactosidase trimerization domain-containing protein [Kaistia sp. 32K]|uniref:beta-galactosidase trimerization domain-containing protein n=1 Tax=Kaistia sp. 32K TaxID=2795690 RepID=UPI001914EE7D|nr:beta-galactosidase trimerization domain-containing protein [Kaistia sp. 32K]
MTGVAASFDLAEARRQARIFKEAGIGAVSYFTHDHHGFAFWPSKAGVNHPGLVNDYVGNMTTALAEEGIRRIAYFQLFTNIHIKQTHPEWLVVAPDGTNPPGAWMMYGASAVCASSPYLDEYIAPLLTELLTTYDIESFWFDGGAWMVDTLCHCNYCKEGFKRDTGLDLPASVPVRKRRHAPAAVFESRGKVDEFAIDWSISDDAGDSDPQWVAWRIWRRKQIGTFLARTIEVCKAARPDVLITDNSIGRSSTPVPAGGNGEPVRWLAPQEIGLDYLCNDALPWGGDFPVTFSAVGRNEATTGMPFDFHNIRFHKWGEWQLRDAEDMIVDSAATLAQGSSTYFADQPYPDGRIEPAVYEVIKEVNAFSRPITDQSVTTQAVPDIAVLASAPSQIFGPIGSGVNAARNTRGAVGLQGLGERTDRIDGAHLALTHSGVQFLIYDEPTLRQNLSRQKLVIVPEQCLLEEATIDALDAYVRDGGALIVTGRSGWWDQAYSNENAKRFDHILGVETLGAHPSPIHYVELSDELRELARVPVHPIMQWGAAANVRATSAEVLADLRGPLRAVWRDGIQDEDHWQHYTTLGACPPGEDIVGPAVTLNRHGKGLAIFVATDPFASHMHENRPHVQRFVQALMERAYPTAERLVSIAGLPPQVEVSVQRDEAATYVHLVGYAPLKRLGAMVHNAGVPTTTGGSVRLRHPTRPASVDEIHTGKPVDWSWTDGVLDISVPAFSTHAFLRVA